jgi:selenocysteine-specific elongation factor
MQTRFFDALISVPPASNKKSLDAKIFFQGKKIPASFQFYEEGQKEKTGLFYVRGNANHPLSLKWKDRFGLELAGKAGLRGKGLVINPFSEKVSGKKIKIRLRILKSLQGDKKEMLYALAEERGLKGLGEKEIFDFSSLSRKSLLALAQELEAEGKIRILSFSPLFILSQAYFGFLCQKILVFLESFHQNHPEQAGVTLERIKRRFNFPSRILSLALKYLSQAGKIKDVDGTFSLSAFKITLSLEEEKVLKKLEEMCFKGEFCSVSLEELQEQFRLSLNKLNRMLSLLIERKKIVQGKDGFFIHSRWLDKIIWRIRESGKRELTVSDFKKMTGLSRKYAIPLLELLDQMAVTRRKGPSRVIL